MTQNADFSEFIGSKIIISWVILFACTFTILQSTREPQMALDMEQFLNTGHD